MISLVLFLSLLPLVVLFLHSNSIPVFSLEIVIVIILRSDA